MAGADTAQPARKDLPVVGDEAAERPVVLVIDEADPGLAERAGFLWSAHGLLLVVVVIGIAAPSGRCLFLAHRGRPDLVLVQRDEVADDAIVELERALVLGEHGWFDA